MISFGLMVKPLTAWNVNVAIAGISTTMLTMSGIWLIAITATPL
jgi:uncharacterized membrane protein SirB2